MALAAAHLAPAAVYLAVSQPLTDQIRIEIIDPLDTATLYCGHNIDYVPCRPQ